MDFLRKLFSVKPPQFTGALLDTRPPEEKANDVQFSEIVGTASAVNWNKTTYRTFTDLDQQRSNECGAFSGEKYLGILYSLVAKYGQYIAFSHSHIYQRRVNAPGAGMMLSDLLGILAKGTTLQLLTNEHTMYDVDSDSLVIPEWMKTVGEQFATGSAVYINDIDFDTIASIIQTTGKGIIALGYFLASEWSSQYPVVQNKLLGYLDPASLHHFFVFTDYVTIAGIQYLVIEDSAHFGGYTRRFLSRDWVNKRIITAGYTMNFKFSLGASQKPVYDGQTIVSAQKCLQYEGFFPTNIAFSENVGPVTKTAIQKFQAKYGLPQTQSLDTATRDKLLVLYNG